MESPSLKRPTIYRDKRDLLYIETKETYIRRRRRATKAPSVASVSGDACEREAGREAKEGVREAQGGKESEGGCV
jgi:hypothetical protein